jgi:hypothetical protein
MHLASGCGSIPEELKPLLAEDDVKLLGIAKWKGANIAFPPIDRGGYPARDGKHLGVQVDPHNPPRRA